MTLRIHMSIHNDDLHKTTAKRNLAGGVAGLDGSGNVEDTSGNDCEIANNKDAVNGYAGLDADSKIPDSTMAGLYKKYVISDDILHPYTSYGASQPYLVYTKFKTITINVLHKSPSTLRISFKLALRYGDLGATGYGKIYKNGNPVGTERTVTTWSGETFIEDLSFAEGDTIEFWAKVTDDFPQDRVNIKQVYIKGTKTQKTLQQAITDNHVGLTNPFSGTNS